MAADPLEKHLKFVLQAIRDHEVVPFLGAGANLCGRPLEVGWSAGNGTYLPSGGELSGYLAREFEYPGYDPLGPAAISDHVQRAVAEGDDELLVSLLQRAADTVTPDLTRVAQYAATMRGPGPLYKKLRPQFDEDYPITPVHEFLASLPEKLGEKGYHRDRDDPSQKYFVIVTTNYDDLLERAFLERGLPFHVVSYMADRDPKVPGKFVHWRPGVQDPEPIEKPNKYPGLEDDEDCSTVILKLHGAVDRFNRKRDSYVITEDDYISYPIDRKLGSLIPIPLPAILEDCSFLFLGYGLRDWNLRFLLNRIRAQRDLDWNSWAVQLDPEDLDTRFWRFQRVEIINSDLHEFVDRLKERIASMDPAGDRR